MKKVYLLCFDGGLPCISDMHRGESVCNFRFRSDHEKCIAIVHALLYWKVFFYRNSGCERYLGCVWLDVQEGIKEDDHIF
jgi:hypothetical protein